LIGALIVLVSSAAIATHYLVSALGYAERPLWTIGDFPLYSPFKSYIWLSDALMKGNTSEPIVAALLMAGVGAAFAVLLVFLGFSKRQSKGKLSTVHGSARWAEKKDLIEAGLLPRPGHILAFAPTRSGKGVGLVIPSLLRWADSVLVYDIKGENYQLTAGWRKEELGSVVIKLDPTDPDAFEKGTSGTFNPLEELVLDYGYMEPPTPGSWPQMERLGSGETASIQNLVSMIVDPDGKGTS